MGLRLVAAFIDGLSSQEECAQIIWSLFVFCQMYCCVLFFMRFLNLWVFELNFRKNPIMSEYQILVVIGFVWRSVLYPPKFKILHKGLSVGRWGPISIHLAPHRRSLYTPHKLSPYKKLRPINVHHTPHICSPSPHKYSPN